SAIAPATLAAPGPHWPYTTEGLPAILEYPSAMYTADASLRARYRLNPASFNAIQKGWSPPVIKKTESIPWSDRHLATERATPKRTDHSLLSEAVTTLNL